MQRQFMQMQKTKMDQMQMRRERQMRKLQREEELEKTAPWLEGGSLPPQFEKLSYSGRYKGSSPEQQRSFGQEQNSSGVPLSQRKQYVSPQPPTRRKKPISKSPRMNHTMPVDRRANRYKRLISGGYGQPLSKRVTARDRKAAKFVDDAADLLLRQMLPE